MEHVRGAYGARASEYIELFGSSGTMHRDDLALLTRHLSIRSGLVLDVGCGPGHLTAHLCSLGVDATGIDLVPEFIEHARGTYPDGQYEVGSMCQLSLPDGSVAGMLAWYSLIHIPYADIDSVLIEFRRVLESGGPLVIGFFDGAELVAFDHAVLTAFYWPIDELAAKLRAAGFVEAERHQRPGHDQPGHRPHGVIVAIAD